MATRRVDPKAPDEIDRALGNAIYLRRRLLGMSQDQLAVACGVSFQQVQKYENGANRVSFSRLVQIAHALKCRVADLVGVLDESQVSTKDVQAMRQLTLPGAPELLFCYEKLSAESRRALLTFLGTL